MKRYAFYMLIMAVAAVAACQKQPAVEEPTAQELEIQEPATPKTYTYTVGASIEDAEVKSNYAADGKFSWSSGDAISVLFHKGDANKFFTLTTTADGTASASFSGEIETGYEIGASDGTDANKRIFALYPASANHTYTAGNYPSFYTPAVNDLSGGKFSANIPMYALNAAEGNFSFGLMTCAYKFTITDLDVAKIQVDVLNNESYYLSGLTSMSSSSGGYLRYDGSSKNISYICDVTSKTAVFYLSCRFGADKHFRPTVTIKDYSTGYTIKSITATKAVNIDSKSVKRLTISAPGTGAPFESALGIDWFTDGSIASVDGDSDGVKYIKGTADGTYAYILFCIKRSILTIDPEKYRSNSINILFNDGDGIYFGYLYKQGLPNLHDYPSGSVVAKQVIENEVANEVYCEFKLLRTFNAALDSGTPRVKLCVFYKNWATSEYVPTTDWSAYKYSPNVTLTLP